MSTNPFRRSSLKDPGGSNSLNSIATQVVDQADVPENPSESLSINTRVPGSGRKHVNFASPPAIPISPASYPPSSPESFRISPAFIPAQPVPPVGTDYSGAIQSDPFHAEAEQDEDDRVIQEALQNAKANIAVVARNPEQEKEEAVKRTLSKFASAPRKAHDIQKNAQPAPSTQRHTMDVDAFKRLLLTGDSGQENSQASSDVVSNIPEQLSFDDSSSDDVSPPPDPSHALSYGDLAADGVSSNLTLETRREELRPVIPATEVQPKQKPPPPKSRHGKSIVETANSSTFSSEQRPGSVRTSSNSSIGVVSPPPEAASTTKRAPPPPLSRRRSQNSTSQRNRSIPHEQVTDQQPNSHEIESVVRATPPPPPKRRPNSVMIRHNVRDLPTTAEESDASDVSTKPSRQGSDIQTSVQGTGTQQNSKRTSVANLNAPAAPPPRRGRGSSRSSIDSPRLGAATLTGITGSTRSSGEYMRSDTAESSVAPVSNANDILADLAALQQEVDAARRGVAK